MKHYVYKLKETKTDEFYYGVRTCECNPTDDNYFGSMKSWKPNIDNLKKEIISEFNSREEASKYESKLIEENIKHPLNRNYHTGAGLAFYGKEHSENTKEKIKESLVGKHKGESNPFYGKQHTESSREKIRLAQLGVKHKEETKKKMSESAKEIDRTNYNFKSFQKRKKIMFSETGEIFISIYQAGKSLGVSRSYIRKHIGTKFRLLNEAKNTIRPH